SPLYHGAAIDALGGQLHPLALVRGLVHGFRANGGSAASPVAPAAPLQPSTPGAPDAGDGAQ
ncbi:hypothetical protein QZL99_05635, partial [Burkholderia multivorans]|nr:hypothetical protein [Burkholderia multivorans]